jgi:hypothetical protein
MKTDIFFNAPNSAKLNENFAKQFGGKVNLDKYTREQLEDMRNKLRTRVFQQEGSAGYNDLLTNETYQKDQAMLQLLNTRIKEMLGEDIKQLRDKMVELSEAKKGVRDIKHVKKAKGTKPDFLDMDKDGDKKEPMKKAVADKKVKEAAKPDFLDMDKDGDKKEPMKKAVKDKKVKEGFPTVADAKARAEKEKTTGKFDKKQTSTGTVYTKKHTKADAEETPEKRGAKSKFTKEGFPTVADAKARAEKEKTTGKFDKKETGTGTTYTRKASTFTDGGDDADTKKAKKSAKLKEANTMFKQHVAVVNESLRRMIAEDEEGKAKAITAASDMVNDFTSWMQRVGQYQTKAIIELSDAIRADFGQAEAEAFKQAVAPALSATLDTLTQQREAISNAVAVLAGEDVPPEDQMGMEPGAELGGEELPMEPGMEPAAPDEMNAGDEFGASDAAAGGAEASGRQMRESKFARKLAESHNIMAKLAK